MKPTAMTVLAAILATISAPTGSDAARHLSHTPVEDKVPFNSTGAASGGAVARVKQDNEDDRGAEWKERSGSRSVETGVIVMSRGEVDPSTLKKGSYAHVVYTTEGSGGATWGVIARIDSDGIVIEAAAAPLETRKIDYGDIDILAVVEDRLTFKSWLNARLAAEKITVMTPEDLDLSKLATGSYAHFVYTWKGFKRTASGKVLEMGADGIMIESGSEQSETAKIGAAEIDTLAFSRTEQAVNRWKKWAERGIVRMSRWDINPSMLEEGLYVHVVYTSGGRKRKAVGRIVDRYGDSVVIQYRVGGKATWAQPEKLEIAYGNIETVVVARDRRDLQSVGITRKTIGFGGERKVGGQPRVALKLIWGTVFGAVTAAPVALSHFPEIYRDDPGPPIEVIPAAILHAAATARVVSKLDPPAGYGPTFTGSLLGCAAVSSAVLLSDLDGYQGPAVAWLGYISVTTLAATIASEISRGPRDEPGFSVGLAPRRNGSLSAVATYRF